MVSKVLSEHKLKVFVESIWPRFNAWKSSNYAGSATIVSGNESADLDSCMSSILYAYLYHCSLSFDDKIEESKLVFPLFAIPREDLSLRLDIKYTLSQLKLSEKSLLFFDEFVSENIPNDKVTWVLVDHNSIQDQMKGLSPNVVGIIDHHDDEGLFKDSIADVNGPRIIKKSGSCSSLVLTYWVDYFKQKNQSPSIIDQDIVNLALPPLLIDTSNMKSKVTEEDKESYSIIKSVLNAGVSVSKVEDLDSASQLYDTLKTLKSNLDGLSPRELLRKDYKEWSGVSKSKTSALSYETKLGISTVGESLTWITKNHADFFKALKDYSIERNTSVQVVMTSYSNSQTGKHERELVLLTKNNDVIDELVDEFISNDKTLAELKLVGKDPEQFDTESINNDDTKIYIFQQRKAKASRKKVAPLLRQFIHGIETTLL
ncbi:DHH phosphoesterase [Nadsonia fulvescens var. elongata DSM 6958]|uniref:DHH phosphoesterase n=1 Tax=Nadsonia fulvescens var. elongata DSM 6958 TaxID=857566 RepID=A0A1E3PMJ8_9ASCO|nr:DHH phosphoesterase [Nadsonia fulvescens var. elongata DSM 6958]